VPTHYVSFPVPADRVPEVALFLYGSLEAIPQKPEAEEATSGCDVPISEEQRDELLSRIYEESEPPFRALLMLLADRNDPSEPIPYADVLDAHPGWSTSRSVAGALGAFGRRTSYRYDDYWPFERHWDSEMWSHYLTMEADIAAFLVKLHGERMLPLER
jgi:hypothetical protein